MGNYEGTKDATFTIEGYKVGDTGPTGGWIFYKLVSGKDNYAGQYEDCLYLETAPEDYHNGDTYTYYWGDDGTFRTGTAIGTGKANTATIVNYTSSSRNPNAATASNDYSVTVGEKVYDDWFLPSKDELNEMYENLCKNGIGNFTTNNPYYWSSSENESLSNDAWLQGFTYGTQYDYISRNNNIYRVRPIRAF